MLKLKTFVIDSVDEMKNKVTWPKYSDLQSSAILVLIASIIFASMIGAFDYVFEATMKWFYKEF